MTLMKRIIGIWRTVFMLQADGGARAISLEGMRRGNAGWVPTHRHRKGGLYRVVGRGVWEADRTDAVIYDDADGTVWIRLASEFEDGRFEVLAQDGEAVL